MIDGKLFVDACAYIGHYPFRKVEHATAGDIIAKMDAVGIDKAVVSSLDCIYYRDVTIGMEDFITEIAPYAGRLIPAATGNPIYIEAMADLERFVSVYHCHSVRLYPKQHGYTLDDPQAVKYLRRAAELGLVVELPVWLEDLRGRHSMDMEHQITAGEIARAALAAPETDFVLYSGWDGSYVKPLMEIAPKRTGSINFDFARCDCLYYDGLKDVVNAVGSEHMIFATAQPMCYVEPQLVKLAYMQDKIGLTDTDMERICGGNAARLFSL